MECENQGSFAGEVGEEYDLDTFPNLFVGDGFVLVVSGGSKSCTHVLDLPFAEVWHGIDNQPRDSSTKVHHLVVSGNEEDRVCQTVRQRL